MEELGAIPAEIGSYRVRGVLGAGGMGVVLRAEHAIIGRPAAIKLLRPESSQNRDIVTRFFNEARAATAIRHPGIVEIYDFGYLPDGCAYLVMEMLEGTSLESRIRARGRLTESEAFAIVRGIATALAAAHAKGIVHRDIKPDNIYLVPDPDQPGRERIKLLDFGIAKLTSDLGVDGKSTRTGAVMGTPCYMAPEQCRGAGRVDHRADLYAVGCVLMHMLTGAPPFADLGVGETIGAHLFIAPPTLSMRVSDASRRAEELVAALLTKDPDQRVQSAVELVERVASAGDSTSPVISGSMWVPPPPPGSPANTTLGAAARGSIQVEDAPPRRRGMLAAGAVVAVAAVGLIALLASGGGGGDDRPADGAGTGTAATGAAGPTASRATESQTGSVAVPATTVDAAPSPPVVLVDAGVAPAEAPAPIDAGAPMTVDAGARRPTVRKAPTRPTRRKPEDLLEGL